MSITKAALDEIANNTATDIEDNFEFDFVDHAYCRHYAHALLTEVQKRLEVVGYRHKFDSFTQVIDLDEVENANFQLNPWAYEPLTTLPLIEE